MPELPGSVGYRLPAEWEPHAATWLAWPHNHEDWPGKFGPIPWVYVEFVRVLSAYEPVCILVGDRKREKRIQAKLERGGANLDRVHFVRHVTDRSWTRDFVPSFVVHDDAVNHPPLIIDWKFNGWSKYDSHENDDRVGRKLQKRLNLERVVPTDGSESRPRRLVLEGGSIDSNGLGTLLTTEECLLSDVQARNPQLDRSGVERALQDYLGIRKVIWLGRGIAGDDTHGHVDDITRFVGPSTVVTAIEPDAADSNHEPLSENLTRLRQATDQDGTPLDVIALPMPRPVYFEGQRLPASYANFYIANGVVLVPLFNDPADREALETLERVFPDRQIVGIGARDLVWGLGTFHCMTHEQPAGVPLPT